MVILMNIISKLNDSLKNRDYAGYLKLFDEYLKQEFAGVNFAMIFNYIEALTQLRRFDEAKDLLKSFKEDALKNGYEYELANLLFCCFELDEAEEILLNMNYLAPRCILLLGKIYLLKGNIEKAKPYFYSYFQMIVVQNHIIPYLNLFLIFLQHILQLLFQLY